MIKILSEIETIDIDTKLAATRHADIIISDSVTHYALGVGGLPLVGDLQPILDAREAELWQVAQAKNNQLTTEEVRRKLFNSPLAGGWTSDEFQEAYFEERKGDTAKVDALDVRRAAIRAEWPL